MSNYFPITGFKATVCVSTQDKQSTYFLKPVMEKMNVFKFAIKHYIKKISQRRILNFATKKAGVIE